MCITHICQTFLTNFLNFFDLSIKFFDFFVFSTLLFVDLGIMLVINYQFMICAIHISVKNFRVCVKLFLWCLGIILKN